MNKRIYASTHLDVRFIAKNTNALTSVFKLFANITNRHIQLALFAKQKKIIIENLKMHYLQ